MNQNEKSQQPSHMNNNAINMGMGGIPGVPAGAAINNGVPPRPSERATLNTYIYDYFLKYEMYDCAQAILREGEVNTNGSRRTSPSRRPQKHDAEGNVVSNGIEDGMDANNASVSSKREEGEDSKPDFPLPSVPKDCPQGCFLYDWWCLFWDIFGARSGAKTTMAAATYLNNTQHAQRIRQEQLLQLRQMNPQGATLLQGQVPSQVMNPGYQNPMLRQGMLPNGVMIGQDGGPGAMSDSQKHLVRQAVMNNNNKSRVPAQLNALKNQQIMQQAARDQDVDMNGQQARPQSPAGSQAANSPSTKRRNLGGGDYQELGPGGRGQTPAGVPGTAQANQAHQILVANGIDPNRLTPQQFQAFQVQNPNAQQKSIQVYAQSLAQHAQAQQRTVMQQQGGLPKGMPHGQPNQAGHAGSPMMHSTSDAGPINMIPPEFYNNNGPNMRILGQGSGTGSHALQDYQMQLMVLEQQNKKRLLAARQEQDSLQNRADQSGNFQGMSPQGNRAAPSPQPPSDIKRGTPKLNPQAGPGSPMPDSQIAAQRNSPATSMPGYNGQVPPEHQTVFYNQMKNMNEMLGTTNGAPMPNGAMMRPPTHPNFNGQMTPQIPEQVMNPNLRQQPAGRGQATGNVWPQQHGPMAQGAQQQIIQQQAGSQQGQQPTVSTPQARQGNLNHQSSMPPPSAPAAQTNGRTQPSSPSLNNQQPPTPTQVHKAAPKGRKEAKERKKKTTSAPVPAPNAVTPSSEPPTPTTPITPQHPASFAPTTNLPVHKANNFTTSQNQSGNGSQPAQPTPQPPPATAPQPTMTQTDMNANAFMTEDNLNFSDYAGDAGNDTLLDNFDFDSFLNNQDEGGSSSIFDPSSFTFGDAVETGTTES